MPDPDDPRYSNSADFFLRGQEILSGGQRIHHAPLLEKKIIEAKIDLNDMKDYLDGFKWGCPPHGGGGIGLERVLFLFLDLQNVRWASLIPRDPKSFPEDTTPHGGKSMRGPEVDLLDYDTARRRGLNPSLPTLEDLSKSITSSEVEKLSVCLTDAFLILFSRLIWRCREYRLPRSQLGSLARYSDWGCMWLQGERRSCSCMGTTSLPRQHAQRRY